MYASDRAAVVLVVALALLGLSALAGDALFFHRSSLSCVRHADDAGRGGTSTEDVDCVLERSWWSTKSGRSLSSSLSASFELANVTVMEVGSDSRVVGEEEPEGAEGAWSGKQTLYSRFAVVLVASVPQGWQEVFAEFPTRTLADETAARICSFLQEARSQHVHGTLTLSLSTDSEWGLQIIGWALLAGALVLGWLTPVSSTTTLDARHGTVTASSVNLCGVIRRVQTIPLERIAALRVDGGARGETNRSRVLQALGQRDLVWVLGSGGRADAPTELAAEGMSDGGVDVDVADDVNRLPKVAVKLAWHLGSRAHSVREDAGAKRRVDGARSPRRALRLGVVHVLE